MKTKDFILIVVMVVGGIAVYHKYFAQKNTPIKKEPGYPSNTE
jgi:hypothetical protein